MSTLGLGTFGTGTLADPLVEPAPILPPLQVNGLQHVFTNPAGTVRRIPATERVGSFEALSQAPGGFISATCQISQAEFDAHPAIYAWGTTWRVVDADDGDRVVWAGRLTDPHPVGGTVTLQGQGWGKLADKDFDHLLWQTRDLDRWTVADSDPHDYNGNVTKRIEANVTGKGIRFRVRRKEVFKRNNAGAPSDWATGMVFWAPKVKLSRIAFTIDKERSSGEYSLQLLKATGPAGTLTLVATYSLEAGQPTSIAQGFTGDPDLLMLRLRRTSETGKARAFTITVKDVKVSALATTDNYKTHQVVTDIASRLGGTTTNIRSSSVNAMPLDVEDASFGQVLDEISLLDNWRWLVEDNGTSKVWRYGPWDERTYFLERPDFPVDLLPLERFNAVRVPYRYAGGVKAHSTVIANPDPLPSGTRSVFQIDLDDPLPPKDIAEAFAQTIANDLSATRYTGGATFTQVMNSLGELVPGFRVRAGDRLKLSNYGGLVLRVTEVRYTESLVTVVFAAGHPLLDRVLSRRKMVLARGRPNRGATLGGFDLERPSVPASVTLAFKEAEIRGGRRKYHAVLDWAAVTEDIEGNGTAIQRYVAQFRPVDSAGTPIAEAAAGGIRRVVVERKNDDDPDTADISTKAILRNLEHPHKWRWQARVLAVDVLGEKSLFSGWTPYAKPASFEPPDPVNLTVSINAKNKQISGDWEAPDPDELDRDGAPTLDRRIAYFEVRLRRRPRGTTDPWVTYRGPKRVGNKTEHTFKQVFGIGRHRWRYEVRSVDHYGNTTAW